MNELTKDSFLGGGIRIWQPKKGYRAGIDPILLAASVNVSAGQKVLDLGCGVGTASFAIGYRVKNVELYGIDFQKVFAYFQNFHLYLINLFNFRINASINMFLILDMIF